MTSISPSFDLLVATRHRTLEMVEKVDQETCDRRPPRSRKLLGEAGTWSIGEILDHILRVYNSLVGEVEHAHAVQEVPIVLLAVVLLWGGQQRHPPRHELGGALDDV